MGFIYEKAKKAYKEITPEIIRDIASEIKNYRINAINDKYKEMISGAILDSYKHDSLVSEEEAAVIRYLENHNYSLIPYDWAHDYDSNEIIVEHGSNGYNYIDTEKGRLYTKRFMTKKQIKKWFNPHCIEMDIRSPHRYVTYENKLIGCKDIKGPRNYGTGFYVKEGDIVADVGCAEANFALSIIDIASHIYLFEIDPQWISALKRTFKDYKHKVTIINKEVSNKDTNKSISLDTFFRNKRVNFIKADIEGAEIDMLNGGKKILSSRNDIKAAICTYHRKNDARYIQEFFETLGYRTSFTNGLIPLGNANDASLRKGILRANR